MTTALDLSDSRDMRYTTLTHRWIQGATAKLLRSNLESFKKSIKPSYLPPVFHDAIDTTRRLGLGYIWIDALCIVQDDPEDWTMESSIMDLVYERSYCNIGASAAADQRAFFYLPPEEAKREEPDREEPGGNEPCGLCISRDPSEYSFVEVRVIRQGYNEAYFGFHENLQPSYDTTV